MARHAGPPAAPTALLYGHYDVQPAGPRAAWRTPPFEPVVRSGALFGRGASDDKGPLLCLIVAVERLIAARRLPVGVVLIADGEEEIGSPTMPALLAARLPRWRPAAAVICDTRMYGPGRPALTAGLRGSLAFELTVEGPPRELHSGQFGGAVHNPLQVLCDVLSAMHDVDGRIAVPGFYDDVRPPRAGFSARPDAEILAQAGVSRGWGEPEFSLEERVTARPALTIAGITGGHQGPGVASSIPASAVARLSLRLVPGQHPRRVQRLIQADLEASMPPTVRWRLRLRSATPPVALDVGDPAHRAVARAIRRVWGVEPAVLRSGGSIPLAHELAVRHRVPTVLTGFSLPGDRAHGPDERFELAHLEYGARTIATGLRELGRTLPSGR